MPFATRNGVRLFWRAEGSLSNPPLLLLHAIGTDMGVWDRTMPALLRSFRVLRMDLRGHGASDVTKGDYTLAMLADDAIAVLDAAGISKLAIVGLSLGGMIAMELALRDPSRASALCLMCTSGQMDSDVWRSRIEQVRAEGMAGIAEMAMSRFLSATFAANNSILAESLKNSLLGMQVDGYAGAAAAIRDMSLSERVGDIVIPTLVLSGNQDVATPFNPHGLALLRLIPGAQSNEIDCGHLAPIETPLEVSSSLKEFFLSPVPTRPVALALYEAGLLNRRRILGDAWVEKSLASRTAFTAEFQEMITRTVWQEIWGRPGLDDRTRRLLVIAVTATQGRWEEFRLHVRSGLKSGDLSIPDLKETLLQLTAYAGAPTGNTAFSEANSIITELEV